MKQLKLYGMITMLIGIAALAVQGQNSNIFVGDWKIDLGATASISSSTRQVDRTIVEKTTTTTVGRGAKETGELQIKADGTYRLNYWYYGQMYKQSVIAGEWREVPKDRIFGSLNTIEMLDVVPDESRNAEMRKWYVIQKEDGSIEARYPPHDGYAKIKLTKAGTKNTKQTVSSRDENTPNADAKKPSTSDDSNPEKTRAWTPDEIRKFLAGKTKQEVFKILGEPVKAAYGTYYFNGTDKIFPPCANGCNYKSFAIQFGGAGETVNSVELQYWLVEP